MEQISIPVGPFNFDALAAGAPDGDLVLCLHGFPESAHEWRDVLPTIAAAGYRVVAPNQRGYSPGARPLGIDEYHITHLDEDVIGIADALGAQRFTWSATTGALSLRGMWPRITRHACRRSPSSRCRTHSRSRLPAQRIPINGSARSTSDRSAKRTRPERLFLDNDAAALRLALSEAAPAVADAHIRILSDPGAMTAALNYYRAWDDALDSVGVVDVPTLFVWSTDDVALGRVAAEATGAWVAAPYRFEVLDGVSHWIPEVAPAALSRLVLNHLGSDNSS